MDDTTTMPEEEEVEGTEAPEADEDEVEADEEDEEEEVAGAEEPAATEEPAEEDAEEE